MFDHLLLQRAGRKILLATFGCIFSAPVAAGICSPQTAKCIPETSNIRPDAKESAPCGSRPATICNIIQRILEYTAYNVSVQPNAAYRQPHAPPDVQYHPLFNQMSSLCYLCGQPGNARRPPYTACTAIGACVCLCTCERVHIITYIANASSYSCCAVTKVVLHSRK